MNTRATCTTAAAVVVLALCAGAGAGSIWAKAHYHAKAIHTDDTARQVGDILTITIAEHSVVENETERATEKSSSRSNSISTNMDLIKGLDSITGKLFSLEDLSTDIESDSDFTGGADFDVDRKTTDVITVTVTDVLPNGNLVVVGSRRREVEGDGQTVQASGVVRPSDIAFDNTVASEKVADFKINIKQSGQETLITNPGWFDRIMNVVNPF